MKEIETKSNRIRNILLVLGILLIAANLRASLTSVGPLIGTIREDTGISNGLAGLLTTLPLFAFAVLSMFAPKIARRFGTEYVLMVSLVVLTAGILFRSMFSVSILMIGTFILGLAIAMGNVLLPSLIKKKFAHKVGLMTGLYTMFMNFFAALASGVSIPFAHGLHMGWRGTLAIWAVLAVVTLIIWLPQLRRHDRPSAERANQREHSLVNLWRSRLAWQVTLFMGLQSLVFYVIVTWLPEILIDKGLSASTAGWMVALMQFISIPANFIVPLIADRLKNQRGLITGVLAIYLIGFVGLLAGGSALITIWMVLLGLGQGACISLALTLIALRAPDAQHTSELSGMSQSVGYLLAAVGPILFGLLRDVTGSWIVPLLLLMVSCILLFLVGLGAGRNEHVSSTIKTGEKQNTA